MQPAPIQTCREHVSSSNNSLPSAASPPLPCKPSAQRATTASPSHSSYGPPQLIVRHMFRLQALEPYGATRLQLLNPLLSNSSAEEPQQLVSMMVFAFPCFSPFVFNRLHAQMAGAGGQITAFRT